MPSVKFAREIRSDDQAIVCGHLTIHHHEIAPPSIAPYGNQRAAIATHDEIRVLNRFEYLIVVACHIIMVFDDVKPALVGQTNRDTFNRDGDIHHERPYLHCQFR
jgi:hypothetical protein